MLFITREVIIMLLILLISMLLQTSIAMLAMEIPTKVIGHKVKEEEYPLYQTAITAVRNSENTSLPNILATVNPNAQVTDVPGNTCRIHFLLTFAFYENKSDAIRYLLDAGADPLITPVLEAEGEQEHAQTVLTDACNLQCVSAEIVLSHIPYTLLLKHGSKSALKHLLLCLRQIKSDLSRDIRNLLCFYCVTACVQYEQLERAQYFCKNNECTLLTAEEDPELRRAILDSFDAKKLSRLYAVWQKQVVAFLQKQMC